MKATNIRDAIDALPASIGSLIELLQAVEIYANRLDFARCSDEIGLVRDHLGEAFLLAEKLTVAPREVEATWEREFT